MTVNRASAFRLLASPIIVATVIVFAVLLAALHFGATRVARHAAEERLRAAAEDVVRDLDNCVDEQLAFLGREITLRYGTPEAMAKVDLTALMKTYFVDEINVVDVRGLCLNSTVPEIVHQDQYSLANPAKFCKALIEDGAEVFSQPFRNSATELDVYRKYVGVAFPPPAKGYVQIGFERARLGNSIDYMLRELAHSWHIGETGFYVISKTINGEIISTIDEALDGQSLAAVGFDIFAARRAQNVDRRDPVSRDFLDFAECRFFESEFAGEPCLCTSGVVDQFHRYIALIPLAEVYGSARRVTALTLFIFLLAMVIVDTFLLRQAALVSQLQGYISAERARQQSDLTLAKTIQTSALPLVFPDEKDYRIFARMDTAREVGGDFYDFYELPSGEVVFLIADVSGKGVPAALFMMRARGILRATVLVHPNDLAAAVAAANDALSEKNDAEMFVTAWVGLYNRKTRLVTFVNAGHNPPLVKRADGSVEWVRARGGLVLAAADGAKYRTGTVQLAPGDSIFLYTDGVSEAMNGEGRQYGEERLEKALFSNRDGLFVNAVRADVTAFVAGAEPSDDITMLALDVKRPSDLV